MSTNSQPAAAETTTSPAVRVPDRGSGTCPAVGQPVEQGLILVTVATNDERPSSSKSTIPAAGWRRAARRPPRLGGVDHRSAVRGGDQIAAASRRATRSTLRLPVVGADDHRVALEKRVRPAGGRHQRRDGRVAAGERLVRGVGARRVRGVVVVGQVVDEKVEPVAGDEPAADPRRVCVDRAERTVPHRDRRPGPVALVERVEEEALRPVHRGHAGDRSEVAMRAAIAGDVDRGGSEAGALERLVHGLGVAAEMTRVQIDHGVAQRPRHAGDANRPERGSVLDDPLFLAVPPDEVRDVIGASGGAPVAIDDRHTASATGRSTSRAGTCRARQESDRGRVGCFEHRRRQAVDDDEDDGLSVARERAQPCVAVG